MSDLVATRAGDLVPGQRVRLPRQRDLVTVIDVTIDECGTRIVHTDGGTYPCNNHTLIDAEDGGEVMPP